MTFRRDDPWTFPKGTVWVKHFDRPYFRPEGMLMRMETRVLVMTSDGVSGATYRWNDEGTDADLVPPEGANSTFYAWTPAELTTQVWRFPSRGECLACHTRAVGGPAGFNTAQLNRRTREGVTIVSQLDAWAAAGCFEEPLVRTHQMPALVSPTDGSQSLEKRVRAYLDSNCASCHRPGGLTRTPWDARIGTALDRMGLIGVAPSASSVAGARVLVDPGHPENSVLFQRVARLGEFHMPPLATSELDVAAVDLLRRWIVEALPGRRGYDAWAAGWLPQPWDHLRSPILDPDGDGLDNFTEYLLGEGPLTPVRSWRPEIVRDGVRLALRFERRAARRFEVEWAQEVGPAARWARLEVEENDPRARSMDTQAMIPLPDGPTRFYRVTVAGE
jgi:mono/diheme cytochrome c family protein